MACAASIVNFYSDSHKKNACLISNNVEGVHMLTKAMVTEVIFDEMYTDPAKGSVRFEFLPGIQTLHLQWYGVLSHEDHTKYAEMTVEHIKSKQAVGWIGDVSHVIEPLPVDIAHYIADTWFPAAVKGGIKKLAIVMPAVEKVKPSAGTIGEVLARKHGELLKTLPVGVFDSRQEAREWISR